jgi:L-methionine (R)-S-oxide reductase
MDKLSEYQSLLLAAKGLMSDQQKPVSLYANLAALMKQTLSEVSWVGFYLYDGNALYLGPFQGKVACVDITLDRGVCGKAARDRATVVVENVHEFPGHIACDEGSNSEIVVPLVKDNVLLGVLDIDSYTFARFNQTDRIYLEQLVAALIQAL